MWNREVDLKDGKAAEDGFVKLLQKRNKTATVSTTTWYNPDYDIILTKADGTKITFEVKHDRMVWLTWNVALEIAYKDKSSWIVNTKADYLVYLIWDYYYYTEAKTLFNRIREYEIVRWWDNNDSELILITKEHFFSLFYVY